MNAVIDPKTELQHLGAAYVANRRVSAISTVLIAYDENETLEAEDLRARQPDHPLRWHAVHAAEVAAVGDRDAQVAHRAVQGVKYVQGHINPGFFDAESAKPSRRAQSFVMARAAALPR